MSDMITGVQDEIARNKSVLKMYEDIGANGAFGAAMIKGAITRAEASIADNDVVAMVNCLSELRETQ